MIYVNKFSGQSYKLVDSYQEIDGTIVKVLQRSDGAKLSVSEDRLERLYLKIPEIYSGSVTFGVSTSQDGTVTKFITVR